MTKLSAYDRAVARYCGGVIASMALTVGVYWLVVGDSVVVGTRLLAGTILAAAALQFVIQLYIYLPVMSKKKPSWRFHSLWFMSLMILVVVIGSLWVMKNLDYNMGMSPEQMQEYMLKEGQKGF